MIMIIFMCYNQLYNNFYIKFYECMETKRSWRQNDHGGSFYFYTQKQETQLSCLPFFMIKNALHQRSHFSWYDHDVQQFFRFLVLFLVLIIKINESVKTEVYYNRLAFGFFFFVLLSTNKGVQLFLMQWEWYDNRTSPRWTTCKSFPKKGTIVCLQSHHDVESWMNRTHSKLFIDLCIVIFPFYTINNKKIDPKYIMCAIFS